MAKSWMRRTSAGVFLLALLGSGAASAGDAATKFPDRPVRVVIPAPPGGAADFIARTVTAVLAEMWGQPVVIETKPGGAGIVGTMAVVRSPADGYTLLGGYGYLIQSPAMTDKLPYDVHKDLLPISQMAGTDDLLIVPVSSPVTTLEEFIQHAKRNAGKLSMGSYGNGSSAHLHAELFKKQTGLLDVTHVPYQGGTPLLTALLASQVNSGWVDVAGARSQHKTGKLRFLAKTGVARSPLLPDVPTFTELGYKDWEPSGFMGLLAPAGTPPDIVQKISSDVQKVLARPEIQQRLTEAGVRPVANSPEAFGAQLKRDEKIWGDIARGANIRID